MFLICCFKWIAGKGNSVFYDVLGGINKDVLLPKDGLKIDLDLTGIKDKKTLERITLEIKLLLEHPEIRKRFSSVHLKIKRSQINMKIVNYKSPFPNDYEIIEDVPNRF